MQFYENSHVGKKKPKPYNLVKNQCQFREGSAESLNGRERRQKPLRGEEKRAAKSCCSVLPWGRSHRIVVESGARPQSELHFWLAVFYRNQALVVCMTH